MKTVVPHTVSSLCPAVTYLNQLSPLHLDSSGHWSWFVTETTTHCSQLHSDPVRPCVGAGRVHYSGVD